METMLADRAAALQLEIETALGTDIRFSYTA